MKTMDNSNTLAALRSNVELCCATCHSCGHSGDDVIRDIGQFGTEDLCAECLKTYDPYSGALQHNDIA